MVTKHNAYDVQLASKTNPAARYVLATDYAALEAENAEMRDLVGKKNESIEVLYAKWSKEIAKAEAANATLDALREVVPEYFTPENRYLWNNSLAAVLDILYPTPEKNQ